MIKPELLLGLSLAIAAGSAMAAGPAMAVGPAVAQGRPSSLALTCGQAAALVRQQGAVVLGTGGYTFDRFVSDRRFCERTEDVMPSRVPTRDTPSCFVGYRCYEPYNRDPFGDLGGS